MCMVYSSVKTCTAFDYVQICSIQKLVTSQKNRLLGAKTNEPWERSPTPPGIHRSWCNVIGDAGGVVQTPLRRYAKCYLTPRTAKIQTQISHKKIQQIKYLPSHEYLNSSNNSNHGMHFYLSRIHEKTNSFFDYFTNKPTILCQEDLQTVNLDQLIKHSQK